MKTAKLLKRVTAFLLVIVMTATSYTLPVNAAEGTDSGYSITNLGAHDVNVTLLHYNSDSSKKLYTDDNLKLAPGQQIDGYNKAKNWAVSEVKIVSGRKENVVRDIHNISISSDTTIKVYYKSKEQTITGKTTFYDYLVKPYGEGYVEQPYKSINTNSNYPVNSKSNNRFAIGTTGQNFDSNKYHTSINGKNINEYTSGTGDQAKKTGIIKGLSDDYKDVVFSVDEPGCFSLEPKAGKTILDNYTLLFSQNGDSFSLKAVNDPSGEEVSTAGNNFFPLDKAASNTTDGGYGSGHNYYFGMRYDIDFTLGDYIGPLNYSFTGDDDLWVILDGKKVVIDLGGIHDALDGTVNLWNSLGLKEGIGATSEAQKNEIHRLTVLYMERGACLSNCQMNFTIPSAKLVEPGKTVIKKSDMLNVTKSAKLTNWEERTYDINLKAYCQFDESKIENTDNNGKDQTISCVDDAVVCDYISSQFDLLDDNGNVIDEHTAGIESGISLADGGVAFYDRKLELVYVVWEKQSVPYSHDGSSYWSRNISVKAKPEFIGGNNIATNYSEKSGVTITDTDGSTAFKIFNQPKVNVRVDFKLTDTENTIFLGQCVSTDIQILDNMKAVSRYAGDSDSGISYSQLGDMGFDSKWYCESSLSEQSKTNTDAMSADKATEVKDKLYYLDATYSAGDATSESNANSTVDGIVYKNGTPENGYTVSATNTGVYTTHVIAGGLTVEKNFKNHFLDGLGLTDRERNLVDAKQTAVFTVYQYAPDTAISDIKSKAARPVGQFKITISDNDADDKSGGSKVTVKGLSEGIYMVEEDADWSWKYNLESISEVKENDGLDNNTNDGIFYIGPEHSQNGALFTNVLDKTMQKIYSDTTNVLNIFTRKK